MFNCTSMRTRTSMLGTIKNLKRSKEHVRRLYLERFRTTIYTSLPTTIYMSACYYICVRIPEQDASFGGGVQAGSVAVASVETHAICTFVKQREERKD